jgi:hypothetical protein
MGTLYREKVEYKYLKASRMLLRLIFGVLALDLVFILVTLIGEIEKTIYPGLSILLLSGAFTIVLWDRCSKCYRYGIIDRELIIERLSGSKRKVVLSLNLSQILYLSRITESTPRVTVDGEYSFTCEGKRGRIYRCVFEKNGKLYSFNFEPSSALLKKIEMYR